MRVVVVGTTRKFFKVGHSTFRVLARTRPDIKLRLVIPNIVDARRAVGAIPVAFYSWDPSNPSSLSPALQGCTTMLMVPPIDRRVPVANIYIQAAKKAGIKYILCLGIQHNGDSTIMAREVGQVSNLLEKSEIQHDVLLLSMFLENLLYQVLSISEHFEFMYPVRPNATFSFVTCTDLAEVFAQHLAKIPQSSIKDNYWIATETLSCNKLPNLLSEAVGLPIRFRSTSGGEFVGNLVD
jgi:uncharacterized protein YbjT (DUF2867 family)